MILEARGIYKEYPGGVKAVQDFSLSIEEGDFVVLVGPSGCGKTTVLRMVAGLESIEDGTLHIDGKDATALKPRERNVAMIFQNYALYPHLSVKKNIEFPLKVGRMPKDQIEARVTEVTQKLGLQDVLSRRPGALSGGQQQRVAIARALVRSPRLFLMDEPLSNLDAQLRVQMRDELAHLHKDLQATIIYVTHDQTEAMTLGNKIVVMKEGTIQQIGSPLDLYRHPRNVFVAGFIGTPQMNLIPATLSFLQNRWFAKVGETYIPLGASKASSLSAVPEGTSVILGIRPESISVFGAGEGSSVLPASDSFIFNARVARFETLGSEGFLYCDFQRTPLVIRIPPSQVLAEGSMVSCNVAGKEWHIFDAMTTDSS